VEQRGVVGQTPGNFSASGRQTMSIIGREAVAGRAQNGPEKKRAKDFGNSRIRIAGPALSRDT